MRKKGSLEQIRRAQFDSWLHAVGQKGDLEPVPAEMLDPGRSQVKRMHDDELADILARNPSSKLARLAESEMRSRESWRGPSKWSLIVAGLAFLISAAAFVRTF